MAAYYGNKTLYFKKESIHIFLEAKKLAEKSAIPFGELLISLLMNWMASLTYCSSCHEMLRSQDNWCPKCGKRRKA